MIFSGGQCESYRSLPSQTSTSAALGYMSPFKDATFRLELASDLVRFALMSAETYDELHLLITLSGGCLVNAYLVYPKKFITMPLCKDLEKMVQIQSDGHLLFVDIYLSYRNRFAPSIGQGKIGRCRLQVKDFQMEMVMAMAAVYLEQTNLLSRCVQKRCNDTGTCCPKKMADLARAKARDS